MYKQSAELFVGSINIKINKEKNFKNGYNDVSAYLNEFGNLKPKLGWIYVENSQVTRYQFYYDDFFIVCINGRTYFEKFDCSRLISVKNFGAVGDGITDDTLAIQSAISYLNENGGIMYFPTGTYLVSASESGDSIINLNSDKQIYIDFFGSTIKLSSNSYIGYNVIHTQYCNNVELRNGVLNGDRLTHDYKTISATHEFGYGIYFFQSQYSKAFNMDIYNMTGDAIINKNGDSGGTTIVSNCNLHHCRRQGISILDSDIFKVDNTHIYSIGTSDGIKGTAPMTGIDIEPASGTLHVNLVELDNINIHDTTSYGIINVRKTLGPINISNSSIQNIYITNATIENTQLDYNMPETGVMNNVNLENCKINIKNIGLLSLGNSTINNCRISGIPNKCTSRIFMSDAVITNCDFSNILGTSGLYKTSTSRQDFGIIQSPGYSSFGEGCKNNTYTNCSLFLTGNIYNEFSTIQDSVIFIDPSEDTILNNLNITNCITRANPVSVLRLNECNISNSGTFANCMKYLTNTYFLMEDLTLDNFKYGSTINNSTIHITNNANIKSLSNVYFSNNSKVILNKYNNTKKLLNSLSTLGTDYTVQYNGNEALN